MQPLFFDRHLGRLRTLKSDLQKAQHRIDERDHWYGANCYDYALRNVQSAIRSVENAKDALTEGIQKADTKKEGDSAAPSRPPARR